MKTKKGRPKKPKSEQKSVLLSVRVTSEEYRDFEKLAKADNMAVSQWVRKKLTNAPPAGILSDRNGDRENRTPTVL